MIEPEFVIFHLTKDRGIGSVRNVGLDIEYR